jgi:hypothetical protein
MSTPSFEQGPIRPPSEAHSLLVRVTRNCAWNRCTFCPVYKGAEFSLRKPDEIMVDVEAMAEAAAVIAERGATEAVAAGLVPPEAFQVALFLRDDARTVFLQDADPCALKSERLADVIVRVRERFPSVQRVTTYGRAATLARRSAEQLRLVADAGLTRVHVGMESGADEVLEAVCKGCTSAQLLEAGRHVLEAGMELCYYFMPGLGGRARQPARAHVRESARVVRSVAAYAATERRFTVRLRTAAVVPGSPLADQARDGSFSLPDDVEVAREIREFIELLGDARLRLVSDHALNLLPEVDGLLPGDRARLVGYLDEFLGMDRIERARFALGRRLGIFYSLEARHEPARQQMLRDALPTGRLLGEREMLDTATVLRSRFL